MAAKGKPDTTHFLIDDNLKRVYRETLEKEVPDRFKTLLTQLREQEAEDTLECRADTDRTDKTADAQRAMQNPWTSPANQRLIRAMSR